MEIAIMYLVAGGILVWFIGAALFRRFDLWISDGRAEFDVVTTCLLWPIIMLVYFSCITIIGICMGASYIRVDKVIIWIWNFISGERK